MEKNETELEYIQKNSNPKVFEVFKKLAGEHLDKIVNEIIYDKMGDSDMQIERAMADVLEEYGLNGSVKK